MKRLILLTALCLILPAVPAAPQDYEDYFDHLRNLSTQGVDYLDQAIAASNAGDSARACQLLVTAGGKYTVGKLEAIDDLDDMYGHASDEDISAMKDALKLFQDGEAMIAELAAGCPAS